MTVWLSEGRDGLSAYGCLPAYPCTLCGRDSGLHLVAQHLTATPQQTPVSHHEPSHQDPSARQAGRQVGEPHAICLTQSCLESCYHCSCPPHLLLLVGRAKACGQLVDLLAQLLHAGPGLLQLLAPHTSQLLQL